MSILTVQGVNKSFAGLKALNQVNLKVEQGKVHAIIGPNGAGKSTLLNCFVGRLEPDTGTVMFDGQSLLNRRPHEINQLGVARVFQTPEIFPDLSLLENVMIPMRRLGRLDEASMTARATDLLGALDLGDLVRKRPDQLSGGQAQRVAIARALMQDPKLMLLDEPTSALDPKISREIMALIKEMAEELNVPCLCNIHDVKLAMEFCNKMIGLQDGVTMFAGPTADMNEAKLDEIYAMEVL